MDDHEEDLMGEGMAASSVVNETWSEKLVKRENPDLSEEKRRRIVYSLLNNKEGNTLPWGAQTKLAEEVGVSKSTVSRLFKIAREATDNGGTIDVSSKRVGRCGRKIVYENSEEQYMGPNSFLK